MDLSKTKINVKAENEGVWVDIDDKTSLLIARYLNPKHREYVNKKMEPYRRTQRMGQLSPEVENEIEVDALSKFVLLDWRHLEDGGKEVPYTTERAAEYLGDKSLSWFLDIVMESSRDLSMYREEYIEDSADNVKKLSAG